MTVNELRKALEGLADELPVFFRRVAPIAGNIEEAGTVKQDIYGFFGKHIPCVVIEPIEEDKEDNER